MPAIQESDIVFVKSQVMDDVPEGGGAATGVVVPDGVMNNVFEDISDLDRAYGRFNLRKLFLAVRSLNTDLYGGAKTVVTRLPEDPAIGYTLFTTDDPFDTRTEAVNAVEAYLYKGPLWNGALNENHIAGMRAISVIQRVNSPLPPIGKTLCLVEDEGLSGQKEQYVRVIDVEAVTTTFTDNNGDYMAWIVSLTLSDALRYDFDGHTVNRYFSYSYTGKTRIRDTTVADATLYYGSQPLKTAANIGDLTVQADSIYTQLVPSAQTETPLVSQTLAPELIQTWDAGARNVDVPQQAHTRALEVTVENRRYNWIETLLPRPALSTLSIAYRVLGNWYVLSDNGAGILSGSDPAFGTGTVNYTSGDTVVTLGALPDAGSQIIYTWASPTHYTVRLDDGDTAVTLTVTVADPPISLATWAASWLAGGITKTASSNASGVISGDATGTVDATTGTAVMRLTTLPDRNTSLTLNYSWYEPNDPGEPSATYTATFGPAPRTIVAGADPASLRFRLSYLKTGYWPLGIVTAVGQADGTIVVPTQQTSATAKTTAPQTIGNYASGTGVITLNSTLTVTRKNWTGTAWNVEETVVELSTGTNAHQVIYTFGDTTLTAHSAETHAITALQYALELTYNDPVVANSLRLVIGGQTYDDYNGDLLLVSNNTPSGTVNYDTRIVTLTYWANGISVSPSITSLLTRFGDWSAVEANFRTALSPIKPEALSIVATTLDGTQITGSADADGVIAGDWMRGTVNYEFGTAVIEFGELDGATWVSREVDPGTIRYNAVAYSYVPLDADILGIDAVRLPNDGRVPIFRAGNVVMVIHTDTTAPAVPAYHAGSDTYRISCGRTRIAWVRVVDGAGETVIEGYTLDRENGIVSWVSLSGLVTPVTVQHTVGDLRLVTDAQINGTLTLARPLTHDYPADDGLVCACLIHGDRRARVSATWDQSSWNSTWVDYLVGNAATATLNTIDYPITVTNEGCDTDRWLLRWLTTSTVELISEKRGLVWSGTYTNISADIAPINPRTRTPLEGGGYAGGVPYMTIPALANGGGWSAGNVVRINTVGAIADFWMVRAISQSDEPLDDGADGCEVYALGNIDRP